LRVDVRNWHVQDEDHHRNQIQFEYVDADRDDAIVAQMHFQPNADGTLTLGHRYIHADFRGKAGLGSQLYRQTESFFQQIANEKHNDVVVQMQMGQRSVIVWAKKMGFEVLAEYQSVLAELRDHPERFTEDEVFVSPESQSQGIVKDKYIFRKETEGRYMEDAIRITMQKVIQPDSSAVEK
jgi:GNAT superfamily N-acetyltransferase